MSDQGPVRSRFARAASFLKRTVWGRVVLGFVIVAITAPPLVVHTPPVGLEEGTPAPRTYRANRTVQFVDEEATERIRAEAAESVRPVYVLDTEAALGARAQASSFFSVLPTTAPDVPIPDEQVSVVAARLEGLSSEAARAALRLDEQERAIVAEATDSLVRDTMFTRFSEAEMPDARDRLTAEAAGLDVSPHVRLVATEVATAVLRPTLMVDEEATEAMREAVVSAVDPVVIVKQAGENIVQIGEVVTAEHLEIIRRLGLLDEGGSAASLAALIALMGIVVFAAGGYLYVYDRTVFDRWKNLLLVAALLCGMVWITRMVLWVFPEISPYALPIPLAAMLATLLLGGREGLLTAVLTTIAGVMLGFTSGSTVVATLVWSLLAVAALSQMTDRRRLALVGLSVVGTGAVVSALATFAGGTPPGAALEASAWGALGGLVAAVGAYGSLPMFEHIFGITTDVRLLELGNPAHPLLRELVTRAPGTYSHSVATANLAEAAAERIGASALLVRVGAYYHDVGKMRRPEFFVENQAGGASPHDHTTPTLSSLIITSHVREGVELAKQHRLPREIVDIISQHHGCSLVAFFYQKALDENTSAQESDFRYGGPRPRSREAALVMLADAAEAAVRSLKKPSQPRVEATVRKVIDQKIDDGQLDEAEITLADIGAVVEIYTRMLVSMYHPRIEYPDVMPGRQSHGGAHHQSSGA